jgi:long-chain acyl-CoA synthetase
LPKEWKFILDDCAAKVVIAANQRIYDELQKLKPELPVLEHVVGLELPESDDDSYAALLRRGEADPVPVRVPHQDEVAGFIYTSGTTGKPKGVLLSHHNIASNISAVLEIFSFEPEDRSLAFLPWAHSYGQIAEVHGMLAMGASVAINDNIARLVENLAEVKPTILFAVPRVFNRIYDVVQAQIQDKPAFIRSLFGSGIRAASRRAAGQPVGVFASLGFSLADSLIFSKVREKFGGRLNYAISASASLGSEVAEFIDALGIPVYEAYGLTETSPIVSANLPGRRRMGSVGPVIPGVRVEIDRSVSKDPEEGEIVVYGPNVMLGYHNRPEENEKVLMADGGFRTGDLGRMDADGYLYITGRIKEQYKLENGKYIMPSPLEEQLKLSPFIANVMLYGANRPYNVALVVLDMQVVRKWATEHHVALGEDPASNEQLRELINAEVAARSSEFKSFERARRLLITTEDFTTDNDMLTPTLKLKRRNVLARFGARLDELYEQRPERATPSRSAR